MRYFTVALIAIALFASVAVLAEDDTLAAEQTTAMASPPGNSGDANTPTNRDYLSLLIAALESYSESGGEAITFDYNLPNIGENCPDEDAGQRMRGMFGCMAVKTQLILKQPQLNANLIKDLTDAKKTDLLPGLEDQLSYTDDLTFTLAVSPQAKKAADKVRRAARQSAVRARMRQNVQDNRDSTRGASISAEMRADPFLRQEEKRAAIQQEKEGAAQLEVSQSKLNLDASYRKRRDTVGPDEWIVKASYEHGFGANLEKRMRDAARRGLSNGRRLSLEEATACADQYSRSDEFSGACQSDSVADVFSEAAESKSVKQGRRLTFALEYHEVSGIDLIPGPGATPFHADSSRSLVWSLAAGRDVFTEKKKESTGRIELSVAYDDVSGDKNRKDRMIGKLTYSQRVSEKLFIPVSLIYANHADYLTNVDSKLSAHFGLAYKIPKGK